MRSTPPFLSRTRQWGSTKYQSLSSTTLTSKSKTDKTRSELHAHLVIRFCFQCEILREDEIVWLVLAQANVLSPTSRLDVLTCFFQGPLRRQRRRADPSKAVLEGSRDRQERDQTPAGGISRQTGCWIGNALWTSGPRIKTMHWKQTKGARCHRRVSGAEPR